MSDSTCTAGECTRRVYKAELCRGHYNRKRLGQPLTELNPEQGGRLGSKDPHDRLKDACFAYEQAVDSDDESARARAWENLVDAAEWVALGVPKQQRLQRLGYRLLGELRTTMRNAFKGNEAPLEHADTPHRVYR